MIANADMAEPYSVDTHQRSSRSHSGFANHVRGLTDHNATLTLTDDPPATDHTVDAGNVSWSFDVPEPTVTHTPAPTATAPSRPAQPTLVVDSDTQITATGVAPDDGGSPITSYDWRHRVRGSGGSGWVDRSNVTSLIQAFSGLTPALSTISGLGPRTMSGMARIHSSYGQQPTTPLLSPQTTR